LIERFREIKTKPDGTQLGYAELFELTINFFLDKVDPLRKQPSLQPEKVTAQQNPSRYVPVKVRTCVAQRSKGQCEFIDHKTKCRCESRKNLEFDHAKPFSLGGGSN